MSDTAAITTDSPDGASGADRLTAPPDEARQPRLPFPVVGIGASAGGLEAYTEFLRACPSDAGIAYVLVQHLPPDRESLLAEILARHTAMPLLEVHDDQPVEPDRVYVIRPGRTLTIRDGRLHLTEPLAARGHGRPVDDFFRSLAEEQQQRAVAVVFSGMGSNGTAGAEAVKAVGGLVIAQEPDSAKFPAMPRSLIDAHLPDYILRPAEVPEALVKYAGHPYAAGDGPAAPTVRDEQALGDVLAVLRTRTRHDFSGYRKPTILRRVRRRMGLGQFATVPDYVRALRQTPAEVAALADDLLIHVTGFFRDPAAWDALREKVIEPLATDRPDGAEVRCWVAACATGEEAYTLAMLLVEAAEANGKRFDVKVFATDMAERALGSARAGVFPNGIESEVTPERLSRFFDKDDSFYRVKKELRELVIFAPQNVLQDPPFSRLDIATCRNLLIYLEPETQRRVLSVLHFGLREGGALLLGGSESIGPAEADFEPIDKRHRLFRRIGPMRPGTLDLAVVATAIRDGRSPLPSPARPVATAADLVTRDLLDRHTPAAVAVDASGQVVHVHGDTARYLTLPAGSPTHDLLALANEQVRGAVRTALHKAADAQAPVAVRDGVVDTPEGRRRVEVAAAPLGPRGAAPLYLVTFRELPEPTPSAGGDAAGGRTDDELQRVRNELQSALEEMQSSNEELKASHEEATSLNEELQSTNEELETSREEMQSLNEELVTVNAQLQAKMGELEATANDLGSLLTSTDIAVLFLDPRFRIRRYTPAVKDLLDLIPGDVGRPLSDLRRKFIDPDLAGDAQAVLDKLVPVERPVASESERHYLRRVLPYRTQDNRIDGVVVAFVDVTERQRVEAELRAAQARQAFVLALSDALRPLADPTAIRETACRLLGARLGADRAYFVEIDEAAGLARVGRHYARGASPPLAGEYRISDFGWVIPPMRLGEVLVVPDVTSSPLVPPADRAALAAVQIGAHVNAPLVKGGVLVGALCVTEPGPRAWAADEAELVRETGERIWAAVERARAEAALRASEAFHELVAGLGSDWWFSARVEPDGTAVTETVGGGFTRILGYTRDELMAAGGWAVLVHPDDRPEAGRQMAKLIAGETIEGELRHIARDGRVMWSQYRSRPEADASGRVVRVYGVARDVTARKRIEAEAADARRRVERIAAATPGLLYLFDLIDGRNVYVNDGISRVLGYTPEAVAALGGDFLAALIHPDDLPDIAAGNRGYDRLADDAVYEHEYRMRHADGSWQWIRSRDTVFTREADGRVRLILGLAEDVTDRKRALDELRERDEQLSLVQRGTALGLSSLDLATGVGVTTAEWRDVVGFPPPPAPQDFATFLALVHSDDRARVAALHAGDAPTAGLEYEFRVNHPARGERWLLSRSVYLPTADGRWPGRPGRLVGMALDVTDRKRAEEQLRRAAEQTLALLNVLPVGVFIAEDADCRRITGNAAGRRLLRTGPDANLSKSAPPGEAPAHFRVLRDGVELPPEQLPVQRAARGETVCNEAVEHRFDDGSAVHALVSAVPLYETDGRCRGAVATIQDVTATRSAELDLRASEERLRAVAANLPSGSAFVVDHDLRYVLAGGEALGPAGFVAADLEGKTLAEVLPPELAAEYEINYRQALGGEPFETEHAAHGRDYITHGVPLRDAAGAVAAALVVSYDITDRKRAERELVRAEARLRQALEAARMGTWHWDVTADLHTRDGNLNRLLGLPTEETRQPFAGFLACVHHDDRALVRTAFDGSVREGRPLNIEFRVVWPDGTVRWLRDQGDVFGAAEGSRMSGACMDITDLKEAEAGLRDARDRLEARVVERTAELAMALESLETEMARRADLARRLATAQEDERRRLARDLHDTVGQTLTALSLAAAAGQPDQVRALADALGRELHDVAVRLRPTALDDIGLVAATRVLTEGWSKRTGAAVDFQAVNLDTRLSAEVETALYRAVQEALTNTAKYAGASRVSVLLARLEGHATATVEDDGAGFDPEEARNPAPGRLGLVGMRERAALLGGSVEVESEPGRGTTVIARIPIPTADPA